MKIEFIKAWQKYTVGEEVECTSAWGQTLIWKGYATEIKAKPKRKYKKRAAKK